MIKIKEKRQKLLILRMKQETSPQTTDPADIKKI